MTRPVSRIGDGSSLPDLTGRDDFEARIARVLGKASAEVRRDLLALLGDPPKAEALTPEVWAQVEQQYASALLPELQGIYMAALEQTAASVGVGFAWDIANERAISWARQYTYELVGGINETSQRWLADAITDFYNAKLSYKDLVTRVSTVFGPARAENIAVTEVTRAAAAGASEFERELNVLGVETETVVATAEDADVCEAICLPKQGLPVSEVGWPPFHPRCRCWPVVKVKIPAKALQHILATKSSALITTMRAA